MSGDTLSFETVKVIKYNNKSPMLYDEPHLHHLRVEEEEEVAERRRRWRSVCWERRQKDAVKALFSRLTHRMWSKEGRS